MKLSEQLRFRLYSPRGFQSLLHRRALRNRQPPEFTSAIWATAGEILDDQAKPAYKARLTALREELEEAKEFGKVERAAKGEEEIEALNANSLAESTAVAAAVAGSTTERACQSAKKGIKTAIDRIARNDPVLGRMLAQRIRTGIYCSYRPDPTFHLSGSLR